MQDDAVQDDAVQDTAVQDGRAAKLPTLDEVAARAGVGRGTVSRVLNGSPKVSEEARAAVLEAVAALGYVRNRAARSLVTGRTDSVALVVSEPAERLFEQPFFADVIRGVSSALSGSSRQLLLTMAQSAEEHRRLEDYLMGQHVDGVMLMSLHGDDPLPERLERRGLPTVVGGRPLQGEPVSFVDIDNVGGAASAVAHLLSTGRRRIATITAPLDMAAGHSRLEGYRQALAAAGIPDDPMCVEHADFTERGAAVAMGTLLARVPDLDAVFVASDLMAQGALRYLNEKGCQVPGDVAVVGFGDTSLAAHLDLTTVHQPVETMGREMADLLVARIDGRPTELHVVLDTHLVLRATA